MKDLFLLLLVLSILFSCSDNDDMAVGAAGIEMSAEPFTSVSGESVAVEWSVKDTVGIFPEAGMQLYFPMVSGAGKSVAQFDGGGWNLRYADRYRAYFPFQGNTYLDRKAIGFSYVGQVQDGKAPRAHLKKYDFMSAVSESRGDGSVYFNFNHLGCLMEISISSGASFGLRCLEFQSGDEAFIEEGIINLEADSSCFTAVKKTDRLKIGLENMELGSDGAAVTVYGMMAPVDFRGHELVVRVVDRDGFHASFRLKGERFEAGHVYRILLDLDADPENALARKVHVEKAGTLKKLLGSADMGNIRSLELSGELDGSDIRTIRELAGVDVNGMKTEGRLQVLDMRKACIVEGGDSYYEGDDPEQNKVICRTEKDIIGSRFLKNTGIMTIWLPENIRRIDEKAFDGCGELSEVVLPEGLEVIGAEAFSLCSELVSIDIPESVVSLGQGAFFLCGNLAVVNFLGKNLRTVADGAFNQCPKLRKVELPSSVRFVGGTAFGYCYGLSSIRLSENLDEMGNTVFFNCHALKEVTIPGNRIVLGKEIFYRCLDLKTVRITNGDMSVLEGNFLDGSSVRTLYLPDSLKEIKGKVLGNGTIVEVYCFAGEPPVMDAGNLPGPGCRIYVPKGSVETYRTAPCWKDHAANIAEIPEGVENEWK